jgi:uncharacterized protein
MVLKNVNEVHIEVTSACNLSCSYCFAGQATHSTEHHRFIGKETVQQAVQKVINQTASEEISIIFHGGEPLLRSADWYGDVLDSLDGASRDSGKRFKYGLQTNAQVLHDEHLDVFVRHGVVLGCSLDGTQSINDRARGGFARSFDNILKLAGTDIFGGVLTTITKANCSEVPDILAFLERNGLLRLTANIFYRNGAGTALEPLTADEIYGAWVDISEYMLETEGRGVLERKMLQVYSRFLRPPRHEDFSMVLTCSQPFCHAGIRMIYVDGEGTIYPCGCSAWVSPPSEALGSLDTLDRGRYLQAVKQFHRRDRRYIEDCPSCPATTVCAFGCTTFDRVDADTAESLCQATRRFHDHHLTALQRSRVDRVVSSPGAMRLRKNIGR